MIAVLCDRVPCQKRARYRVIYDSGQSPVDVCYDHLAWPADLSLHSGGNMQVAAIHEDPGCT